MISKMKKILLAGKIEDREKVLTILRSTELVHVDAAVPEKIKIPEALNSEYEDCAQALSILAQLKVEDDNDLLETPGTPTRLVEETLNHNKAIGELKNKLNIVNRELDEVEKWGNLGLKNLEYLKQNGINYAFLKGPSKFIEEIESECIETVTLADKTEVIGCFSRKPIKFSEKFTQLAVPKREFAQVSDEKQVLNKSIEDNVHALHCLKQRYSDIEAHFNKLGNKRTFKEVETGVFCEDKLFVLTGWCPQNKTQQLLDSFEESGISVGINFYDPGYNDIPPTKLENGSYAASLQPLLKFMGMTPSYYEPDTSFLFLSSLILFASFILADFGYGLLMLIPLLVFYKKLLAKGFDAKLLKLLIFITAGTTVYGIVTNSFFGYRPFNFGYDPAADDMLLWQKLCFFIGAIHLTIAHVMKMLRNSKDASLLGEAGWLVFLWAMYGLICQLVTGGDLGVFKFSDKLSLFGYEQVLYVWMFELSAILILFFTKPSLNIVDSLIAGLGSIASNASGMFSDILSYIRLWAVGLAGGKVASAFNSIGGIVASIPVIGVVIQIIIFVAGHLLNIALSCISVLAHAVRLNLLEFSSHLGLEWAGREYDPFKEKN
ncbi:MAG: hypothetical protein II961_03980 [Candidatus Riflebacteria bacterium]|nr:hypothetical protein [Candidatus Riflebacteria bacterium]